MLDRWAPMFWIKNRFLLFPLFLFPPVLLLWGKWILVPELLWLCMFFVNSYLAFWFLPLMRSKFSLRLGFDTFTPALWSFLLRSLTVSFVFFFINVTMFLSSVAGVFLDWKGKAESLSFHIYDLKPKRLKCIQETTEYIPLYIHVCVGVHVTQRDLFPWVSRQ